MLCGPTVALVVAALAQMPEARATCAAPVEEGSWLNDDPNTTAIVRVQLRYQCQDQVLDGAPYPPGAAWYVAVSGRCEPDNCAWAEVPATRLENGDIYVAYDHGFAVHHVRIRASKSRPGELWIWTATSFVDAARRGYQTSAWFHRLT